MHESGMGFLLSSWWAFLAGGICAILLIIRTGLEDRTLLVELPGYQEYARPRYVTAWCQVFGDQL
jgi:protein-S-isoprenylcysteine O-methyltransferase Ste14